jgi:hypothetical protein
MRTQDILTAWKDGHLCGLLATWDYQSLMRYVVTDFTSRMQLLRHVLRVAAWLLPIPRPPRQGQPLRFRFVVLALAEDQNAAILRALLAHLHNGMLGGPWSHYALCLHERDPLNTAVGGLCTSQVASNLFLFPIPGIDMLWTSLSGRLVYPGLTTYL